MARKKGRRRNMEKYAPLILEECYVKHRVGLNQVKNSFELSSDSRIEDIVNPSRFNSDYRGVHLFVMCHGFQGSSFDM